MNEIIENHQLYRSEDFSIDQVSIRMVKERTYYSNEPILDPESAVKILADELNDYDREVVAVINMDSGNKPININIVSIGSLDRSIVAPREMLKTSILCNASKILMIHNHPSGSLEPSFQDLSITERMKRVYDMMGIELLDHIIVGHNEYYSINEHNHHEIKEHDRVAEYSNKKI